MQSPAGVPVFAKVEDLTVATVFPSNGTARLLVFKGTKQVSGSSTFDFPSAANFGAAWVEEIRISNLSRFVVKIRVRQTCGAGSYDYTFDQRYERWVLSKLQREELRCTETGITSAWKKTYNYLDGRLTSVEYRGSRQVRRVSRLKAATLASLEEFQALAVRYE